MNKYNAYFKKWFTIVWHPLIRITLNIDIYSHAFFCKANLFFHMENAHFFKKMNTVVPINDQFFLLVGKLFIITLPTNCENQAASNSQIPDTMCSLLGRNS